MSEKELIMNNPRLETDIFEMRATCSPRRQLELNCRVANSAALPIFIVDAWVKVTALNGLMLADGRIFHTLHNRRDPAIISPGGNGLGSFVIELPDLILFNIEQRRAGGDIELVFSSRVRVSQIHKIDGISALGIPYETEFGSRHSEQIKYPIPQSEWVKVLKDIQWSELEIIELPASILRSNQQLARALKRFNDAKISFRHGDWDATMLNCRKAFEAIVQSISGSAEMKEADGVFLSIIGDEDKANHVNGIVKELGKFLHLGRHEQRTIVISRSDAQLALHLTGSLLMYVGDQ